VPIASQSTAAERTPGPWSRTGPAGMWTYGTVGARVRLAAG
jgi:hypothetical protein